MGNIAHTETGTGEDVALIGGTGVTAGAWDLPFKPALVQAGYRVIAVDSRGTGGSYTPPPPYSIADMARDTIDVIESAATGPCRVVGLSLGGFVAEEISHQRPDLVRSVALIAGAGRTTAYLRAKMLAERELFAGPGSRGSGLAARRHPP
ncbi:alpha/beta fold hydrolase [Nonomuraea guangzhouensis]|uniref:Alpha/beta fold hydrolase n=1 Tax=Nonomuraea guangzhouensis TaxID=1291555 RepID=A0ABW4GJL2_9ACTN|nr:alpha/beta hydrolase [Nonomuraea guangzhouensis]